MENLDFDINNSGSITSITPLTEQARKWISENVHSEPWQWMGCSLAVDARMADDLIEGIIEAGFTTP